MGGIPILNDNQMNALRRIVGTNQKFNLTSKKQTSGRRRPTYEEDSEQTGQAAQAEYRGPFAVSFDSESGKFVMEAGWVDAIGTLTLIPRLPISASVSTSNPNLTV